MKTTEKKRSRRFSDQELIALLQHKANKLGRSPTMNEMNTDINMPSGDTFVHHFGSFNKALKTAGLEINTPKGRPHSYYYSNERLIALLQRKARQLHHTPTVRELNADKDMPTHDTYVKRFGSYNNALDKAGLKVHQRK